MSPNVPVALVQTSLISSSDSMRSRARSLASFAACLEWLASC